MLRSTEDRPKQKKLSVNKETVANLTPQEEMRQFMRAITTVEIPTGPGCLPETWHCSRWCQPATG